MSEDRIKTKYIINNSSNSNEINIPSQSDPNTVQIAQNSIVIYKEIIIINIKYIN